MMTRPGPKPKPKTKGRALNHPILSIYEDERMLFYLRTHPEWYKILARYPNRYSEFNKLAKEELKLTTYHRLERFKNQVSLLGMLSDYMKRGN
jgi:YlbE-like protein